MAQQALRESPNRELQVIEDNVPDGLEIRESPGQGKGIFATRPFKKGELLYTASIIYVPDKPAKLLLRTAAGTHELDTFVHGYVSSRKHGHRELEGVASFINHSCCPTCCSGVDVEYTDTGLTHKGVACRDIQPGDQVTEDYDIFEIESAFESEIYPCLCGFVQCRGRIRGFSGLNYTQQCSLLGKAEEPLRNMWLKEHPEVLFKELLHPADIRIQPGRDGLQLHTSRDEEPEMVDLEVVQRLILSFPSPDIDPELPYGAAIKETQVIDLLELNIRED